MKLSLATEAEGLRRRKFTTRPRKRPVFVLRFRRRPSPTYLSFFTFSRVIERFLGLSLCETRFPAFWSVQNTMKSCSKAAQGVVKLHTGASLLPKDGVKIPPHCVLDPFADLTRAGGTNHTYPGHMRCIGGGLPPQKGSQSCRVWEFMGPAAQSDP
jgi:hypothetical protein